MPVGVVTLLLLFASLLAPLLSSPINRQVGISQDVFITLQNDTYGHEHRVCSIDSQTYGDGETIPTSSPCEHCICRPPGFACTIISCEYRAGCKAIKRSNQCCPEYQCECEKDGKIYGNGEKIVDGTNPCEICYCQGGEILCAVIDCYWRSDCQPRYVQDRCCPLYDHCPPPHQSQGPFAQRISTTSPSPTTTTGGPFPWANLSSAVFNEIDQDRPLVVVATRRPQVAVLGSSEVEEEKKEIFSAPHYLPEAPPKTEELSSPAIQEKVSEEKEVEGNQDEAVSPSQEIPPPPTEVTTGNPSNDDIEEPTTHRVHVSEDEASPPLVAAHDPVVDSTDAPSTEGPLEGSSSVGTFHDESSGTQATVSDDEVVGVTEGPSSSVAADEAGSSTEVPESVVNDEVIRTTEESTKVLKDFVASTEAFVTLDEAVVTTEEYINAIQDEPPVATERPTDISADEPAATTESSSSVVQDDEVVPTTEESYSILHDEKPDNHKVSHSQSVNEGTPSKFDGSATEVPIGHDAITAVPVAHDEKEPTEVPSEDEEQFMTEAPVHDEAAPTTQVPSGVAQDEPSAAETEKPSSGSLHDDAGNIQIPTTFNPVDESFQSHDDADVGNAAENIVNVSSEDIIPPEEGVAELPEIHSQVFSGDADTIELSAPVKLNEDSPTSVPLTSADEPEVAATTPADFPGEEEEDVEPMHTDDQHAQEPEEGTEEHTTSASDVGLGNTNRFRLDLSSNEISSEEGKKPLDVFQDATTARVFRDELTSDDVTTEGPLLNDESVGTTEETGVQHDEVSTLPPSFSDSRLRTGLEGRDEAVEASTGNILRDETDVAATTEAPSRLRTGLLDEDLEQNEVEATALPTGESLDTLNDENIEVSTSSRFNDEVPTTFASSRLRSDLFDSVESVEKTTLASNRLRSGLVSIEQESVEQSTVREDNKVNDEETVSFDAAGETTIAPSRLRSGIVSSEEVNNEVTTLSPSRLRTALGQSEEEEAGVSKEVKTTEASTFNDEPSELTTAASSGLRAGLLEEEESVAEVSTLPPNRLRSALSQELFSSEDDLLIQTTSSAAINDESPSALPEASPTSSSASALPQEPQNRLRTSGEEDSASTGSPFAYQDFVEVTSTAPIQEEFISYTSQQNLRSDDSEGGTTEPSSLPLHDESPSSNTVQPSDSEVDASTVTYALHDDAEDEEGLETTALPAVDRRVFEMPSRLPPVDPAMPRVREEVGVVGGDEEIHSDDGLSSSSQDSWFAATYNKLRALAGLFPKKDASPKSKGQRSPRRHL